MTKEYKHVGKMKNTGEKVAVAFRTVPGESNKALVVQTAQLSDAQHDSLMKVIESDAGQEAFELGEVLFIRQFPDGRPMLRALDYENRLKKVDTDNVIMTPTPTNSIPLADLNALIAEQRNVSIDDLYTFVSGAPGTGQQPVAASEPAPTPAAEPVTESAPAGVLTDADLAKSYRSQADTMYKEAARLRREADDLDPPAKKKSTKTKAEASTSA